jgi:hypothetical protein
MKRAIIIITTKIKYLEIKLTKQVKCLYYKNYKTLVKTEVDIKKWKYIPFHGSEESVLLKCLQNPKLSTNSFNHCKKKSNVIPHRTSESKLKIYWNYNKIPRNQINTE